MELKKSLGAWDLVGLNVAAIVGLRWISLSAAAGNVSMLLWAAALLFFFLPQAFTVIELTRRLPGEGGIYLWTKTSFGDAHGFMAGWCYWTNNLVYFPNLMVYIAGISVFVAGGGYQAVGESKAYVLLFSLGAIWMVTVFNIVGLKLGRWVNNIGGFGMWAAGTALIVMGAVALVKYGVANPMPAASFFTGIFTFEKMTFWASICFAFTGLELASVMAGEVKDAKRSIPRAVVISGVVIAALYILGTFALLVGLPANDINIITGILQGIAAIGAKLGLGWISNVIALMITLGGIGGLMAWFTGAARMPFVAGVDRYLPESFGRIHPKYGSPYVAILVQALISTVFIIMSFVGAGVKEAYLILLDTTLLVYFVPYVYMFAAYLYLRFTDRNAESGQRIPRSNALAYLFGACGLVTSLFAMIVTVIPGNEIQNVLEYEIKVVGGFLLFILVGVFVYWAERRKAAGATAR